MQSIYKLSHKIKIGISQPLPDPGAPPQMLFDLNLNFYLNLNLSLEFLHGIRSSTIYFYVMKTLGSRKK